MNETRGFDREAGTQTWYLAICSGCEPSFPVPFWDEAERDRWADAHRSGTGHFVGRTTEVRARV